MLKIWGRISSINVRKVVLTARLLQLPFERIVRRIPTCNAGTTAFASCPPRAASSTFH